MRFVILTKSRFPFPQLLLLLLFQSGASVTPKDSLNQLIENRMLGGENEIPLSSLVWYAILYQKNNYWVNKLLSYRLQLSDSLRDSFEASYRYSNCVNKPTIAGCSLPRNGKTNNKINSSNNNNNNKLIITTAATATTTATTTATITITTATCYWLPWRRCAEIITSASERDERGITANMRTIPKVKDKIPRTHASLVEFAKFVRSIIR